MKSHRFARLVFLLLLLGMVVGGGCFTPPPGLPNLDPACPTESDLGDPFPAMLPKGTTSTAGETSGQFSVTSDGQPRYAIPFALPPSRGAMGPQIGLVYDGAGGDGPAGVGFSLSGFSVVNRCPKNIAQDGDIRGVKLDEDDALCLEGLRIVRASAGEFRTFPDTFRKIVVKSKKEPIRVYAKDGTIQTYEPITSRAWWITRNEDRNGNFITYGYRNEAGEVVPDFIEYTGHPNAPATRRIEFVYEPKPVSARRFYFRNGEKIPSQLRLREVRTLVHNEIARTYRLTHGTNPTTGRMRLDQIEECAADGICKQPTSFTWNTPEATFEDIKTPLLLPASLKASVMPMDITGDGLDDLVFLDFPIWNPNGGATPRTEVKVSINAGPDAAKPFFTSAILAAQRNHIAGDFAGLPFPEPEAATPLDYSHDGRSDLLIHDIYARYSTWKIWEQQPDHSFSIVSTKAPRLFQGASYIGAGVNEQDASAHLADVDNDGMVDLIQCRWVGSIIEWYLHRWTPEGFAETGQLLPNLAAQPCNTEMYTLDVDADGKTDLLMREAKLAGIDAVFLTNYIVAKFDKDGVVSLSDAGLKIPPEGGGMLFLDANGDALPDAMQWGDGAGFTTFLNTGNGFAAAKKALFDPLLQLEKHASLGTTIDREGDGLQDFLLPIESGGLPAWKIMHSRGDGTFSLEDTGIPFDAALTPGGVKLADPRGPRVFDVDGDGANDVLLAKAGAFHVYRNRGAQPDVLVGITEGMAAHRPGEFGHRPSVAIQYGNLIDKSAAINAPAGSFVQDALPYVARYDESNACEYPVRCVVGPKRVVTGYELDTGAAQPRRFGLRYRDGRWHRLGRGFLGFGMRIVDDLDTGAGKAEVFDVNTWDEGLRTFPFSSEIIKTWSWAPSRDPQNDDTIEVGWSSAVPMTVSTNGGASYFVTPSVAREVHAQGHFWAYENPWDTAEGFARDAMKGAETTTRLNDTIRVVGNVDLFGNVREEAVYVARDHGLGFTPSLSAQLETRVEREFVNAEKHWLLGQDKSETKCSKAGDEKACTKTDRTFDSLGRLKTIKREAEGDDATNLSILISYDGFGNVTRSVATDVFGGRRSACISYEDEGIFPFAAVNRLGHRWLAKFDAATGAQLASIDPNNLATLRSVDGFGRVTRELRPDGTETTSTRTLVTDANTGARHVETMKKSLGWGEESAELDVLGRVVRTRSPGVAIAGTTPPRTISEVVYDELGERIWREYMPYAETAPKAERKYTEKVFDAVGRVTKIISPWGGVSSTLYDGENVITKNARGFTTTTTFDAFGRQVKVVDAEKGTTLFVYGATGLRKFVDPGGAETVFTRDAFGRVLFLNDPDRGTVEMHYNGFGEVRLSKDALGREVSFSYDAIGRLTQREEDVDGVSKWVWDLEKKGLLSEVHAAGGAVQRAKYDGFGRVASRSLEIDGETFSLGFGRDAFGRLESISYPEGMGIENVYDAAGHLVAVNDAASAVPYWELKETDGAGRTTRERLGAGIETTRKWSSARNRVEAISTKAADGSTLQDLGYGYDAEQNVSWRSDKRQAKTEWFKHDGLDRLTCASFNAAIPCVRMWAFAPNGNLIAAPELGTLSYDDPAHVHAATGANGETFGFDAVGNQITRPGATVSYTAFDQPRAFEAANGIAAVLLDYGGDGLRVRKSTVDAVTVYLEGLYERVTHANGDVEQRYYVEGPERPIAMVVKKAGVVDTRYLHVDALGSLDVVTNPNGEKPIRTSFDPFGGRRNPVWGEAPAGAGPPGVTLGFTGHEQDDEVGLVNMRGRLFDPKIGRFITPDPFVPRPWDGQSWNPYSYTLNNPLKYVDPSGFDEESNGWDPNGNKPFVDPTYDPKAPHLDVVIYGRKDHSEEPARESKANAGTWDVSTVGEIQAPEMEPRPAPETSAYDPEWRHSPGIQYGIGIGTGIALGNVPFAPIAMDFGIATGMVGHGSKYANVGRALGEMAVGITLLMGGVTGEILGGLLDVTTIGAFLGVPVAVVSFGLVVSGLADLGAGAAELSAAMSEGGAADPPQQAAPVAAPKRRGGDTPAAKKGREVHEEFRKKVKEKQDAGEGWKPNPKLTDRATGKNYYPDAITPNGHPIELKPNTPSGRAAGQRQIKKYEELTKKRGRVIYYEP